MLLKVALNGSRRVGSHPALPVTPEQAVAESLAAIAAGAGAIHVHVRASDGSESLSREDVARFVGALRENAELVSAAVEIARRARPR